MLWDTIIFNTLDNLEQQSTIYMEICMSNGETPEFADCLTRLVQIQFCMLKFYKDAWVAVDLSSQSQPV